MIFKQLLIENDSVLLQAEANDWQSAIKLGTDLLVKSGAVKPSYYDAIIDCVEKMGPYIIIAPQFAMPHARPEDGVIKTAFALVTLKKPVYFEGEDEPVDVFVTLAGSTSDEHMKGLMEVTQAIADDDSETGINLDKLRVCRSKEAIYNVIDQALGED